MYFIGTDSNQNVFIADKGGNPKINKYDVAGNFVKSFVKQGSGPGEISRIGFFCMKNDTIYVGDWNTSQVSLFDNTGEFLKTIQPKGQLARLKSVGTNKFVCMMFNYEKEESGYVLCTKTMLLNNSLLPIKELSKNFSCYEKTNLQDESSFSTASNEKIYLGVNDKNNFKINVYDHDGNLLEIISKDYFSICYTEEEINKIEIVLRKSERNLDRKNIYKKRAVNDIYIDKNGNLLAEPAVDTKKGNTEGFTLDFFKNNIYLNTTVFKTDEPYYQCDYSTSLRFLDDRMFLIYGDKNLIEVYEY